MAEGFVNHYGNGWLTAYSAGSKPAGVIMPNTIEVILILQSFTGLPLLPSDATLTKEAREEINADFTLVRIGKDQTGHGSDHKLMPPARIRAIESKLMQSFYEFAAGNRGKTDHLTRDLFGRAN